jgi:hypothetical protein
VVWSNDFFTNPLGSGTRRSKIIVDEYRHGFALLLYNVAERISYILMFPQPSRASMPCPSLSINTVITAAIEFPTGVCLESIHDFLGLYIRFNDRMHVTHSYMCAY